MSNNNRQQQQSSTTENETATEMMMRAIRSEHAADFVGTEQRTETTGSQQESNPSNSQQTSNNASSSQQTSSNPSSSQSTTPRASNTRWSVAEKTKLIEYYMTAYKVTRMRSFQASSRRMQNEASVWEAVSTLFNSNRASANSPHRSRDAMERQFRDLRTRFLRVYDLHHSTGRNGAEPNAEFPFYGLMWDCLRGDPQIIPLATFTTGSQTLRVNNLEEDDDDEEEEEGEENSARGLRGNVSNGEREELLEQVLNSAGAPTRRNYQAMMGNGGVEPPRRRNRRRVGDDDAIEAIRQIHEENRNQRTTHFEQLQQTTNNLETQTAAANATMAAANDNISSMVRLMEANSARLGRFLQLAEQRFQNRPPPPPPSHQQQPRFNPPQQQPRYNPLQQPPFPNPPHQQPPFPNPPHQQPPFPNPPHQQQPFRNPPHQQQPLNSLPHQQQPNNPPAFNNHHSFHNQRSPVHYQQHPPTNAPSPGANSQSSYVNSPSFSNSPSFPAQSPAQSPSNNNFPSNNANNHYQQNFR